MSSSIVRFIATMSVFATACSLPPRDTPSGSTSARRAETVGAELDHTPTRYPIILHHGFGGGEAGILSFNHVTETLRAEGYTAVQTEVPPFDGIETRVLYLRAVVDETLARTGAERVNIIAHSLGGLDARHLISKLGYGDRVASLTTISAPHRGTAAADFSLAVLPTRLDPAIDALARLIGAKINEASEHADVRAGLMDLSEARATAFNDEHPDDPRVYYQSWAGISSLLGLGVEQHSPQVISACQGKLLMAPGRFDRLRPIYRPIAPIVGHGLFTANTNDGLVEVQSARWGNFRGCLPADHSEEVGRYFGTDGPNRETGFDHLRFYGEVAAELATFGY